jgi:ADP-heptose:LPS heptosyltransferase
MRSKAFFINGGYGRVLCSIPALEKYEIESEDKDFIIVCEGGTDAFKGHPSLDNRAFDVWHKQLFKDKIKDRDIVSLEPYRRWEYYNQKCNLIQAFDVEINNKGIRELTKPSFYLNKDEILTGKKLIKEVKEKLKKDKAIIIQPFGRGIQHIDNHLVDPTGRSIELTDLKILIRKLQEKNFGVILMSEVIIDFSADKFKDEVAIPQNVSLRQWAAAIKFADHFLGCDSVGQHIAYSVSTPSTVITGPTFPINISYPDYDLFEIVDLGMHDRVYDPIRIMPDESISRHNENLMSMTAEIHEYVIDRILRKPKDKENE